MLPTKSFAKVKSILKFRESDGLGREKDTRQRKTDREKDTRAERMTDREKDTQRERKRQSARQIDAEVQKLSRNKYTDAQIMQGARIRRGSRDCIQSHLNLSQTADIHQRTTIRRNSALIII